MPSSGSIIEVADGSGGFLRARLETHPQREWQWEAQDRDVPADTFDGRRVTFSYDPVIEQLTAAAETIGTAPSFESVWLYPGQSAQQGCSHEAGARCKKTAPTPSVRLGAVRCDVGSTAIVHEALLRAAARGHEELELFGSGDMP